MGSWRVPMGLGGLWRGLTAAMQRAIVNTEVPTHRFQKTSYSLPELLPRLLWTVTSLLIVSLSVLSLSTC